MPVTAYPSGDNTLPSTCTSIAQSCEVISKNDSTTYPTNPWRYITVVGTGDVKFTPLIGSDVTVPSAPDGLTIFCNVIRVYSTGTGAGVTVLGFR